MCTAGQFVSEFSDGTAAAEFVSSTTKDGSPDPTVAAEFVSTTGGGELIQSVRRPDPRVAAVFVSAFTDPTVAAEFVSTTGDATVAAHFVSAILNEFGLDTFEATNTLKKFYDKGLQDGLREGLQAKPLIAEGTIKVNTNTYIVNTHIPSLVITPENTDIVAGQSISIKFQFSESILEESFTIDDITVSGGNLSNLVRKASDRYTVTFTQNGAEETATISVVIGKYSNIYQNLNTTSSKIDINVTFTDLTGSAQEIIESSNIRTADKITVNTGNIQQVSDIRTNAKTTATIIVKTMSDTAANVESHLVARTFPSNVTINTLCITDWINQDLSNDPSRQPLPEGNTKYKLVINSNKTFTVEDAERLNLINEFSINADNVAISLAGGALTEDNKNTHFNALNSVVSNNTNTTITVTDDGNSNGSTINLFRITTLRNIKTFTINGDTGANIIGVPDVSNVDSIINLGTGDAVDRIYFNIDSNNFISSGTLTYTRLNDFEVMDIIGILIDGEMLSISSFMPTSSTADGIIAVYQRNTIVEVDNNSFFEGDIQQVSKMKERVAGVITSVSEEVTNIIFIFYYYNTTDGSMNALLVAADLSKVTTSDLQDSDDFSLKGIADILVTQLGDLKIRNFNSTLPRSLAYP